MKVEICNVQGCWNMNIRISYTERRIKTVSAVLLIVRDTTITRKYYNYTLASSPGLMLTDSTFEHSCT